MAKRKITQNVNKDKLLNDLPKVNPLSSKWLTKDANYQACNLGQIVPIYYEEILPDQEKEITMGMVSHTTTPVAPIFPCLYTEIRAFWVPMRLCADLLNGYKTRKSPWVKVFGEDNANSESKIIVPLREQSLPEFTNNHQFISDLYNYYDDDPDKDNVFDSLDLYDPNYDDADKAIMTDFNYLSLAAYELIYQRWYRNENFESATESPLYRLLFDAYNPNKASVSLSSSFTFEMANREKDYFTGMKPFTQKGDPMAVGVGGTAPVKFVDANGNSFGAFRGAFSATNTDNVDFTIIDGAKSANLGADGATIVGYTQSKQGFAVADLSSASGISIEELRILIKTQELLEKDAMYGTRYAESLNAHFGCCPLNTELIDPAELYKVTITSNMQAIFQTSTTENESSILGTIGANSTTQTDPFVIVPKTKFKEHGILMICAVHKLQNVYDSSYFKPKFNFKKKRFDFYTPELNDLGFQPVTNKEMIPSSSEVAGYNEAFAEYRYKFNKVHGSLASEFPYWAPSISTEYASVATLYKEGVEILDKALSKESSVAPQFYDAWGFEETEDKPMSLHSIPGFDGVI